MSCPGILVNIKLIRLGPQKCFEASRLDDGSVSRTLTHVWPRGPKRFGSVLIFLRKFKERGFVTIDNC